MAASGFGTMTSETTIVAMVIHKLLTSVALFPPMAGSPKRSMPFLAENHPATGGYEYSKIWAEIPALVEEANTIANQRFNLLKHFYVWKKISLSKWSVNWVST